MKRKIESIEIIESHCADEVKIEFDPSKYEMVERENGYYVVKKQPKYPTTYEECYDEDNIELHFIYVDKNERDLCESFIKLIRCRNAYWKIAGEEMGLGKPWEPDWTYNGATKYCIGVSENKIQYFSIGIAQYTLAFPTKEMRDAFYDNFEELIKECKSLL